MVHPFSLSGALILDIMYGIDVDSDTGAMYFEIIEKAMEAFTGVTTAGAFLGAYTRLQGGLTSELTKAIE